MNTDTELRLAPEFVIALVEMLRQFLDDLGFARGMQSQNGEPRTHLLDPLTPRLRSGRL
jgi:hypothetical protein